MTKLLVSVRSADEARAALAGGADLLDVKEPVRGSLGSASEAVWREVLAVADGTPVSAALGELLEPPFAFAAKDWQQLRGFSFAKLGLSGCLDEPDWRTQWESQLARLPPGVSPVAVCYADWKTARAPPPAEIIEQGVRLGCTAVLLDTFDKQHGSLCDCWTDTEIGRFVQLVKQHDRLVVIGGSLTIETIPAILRHAPDYIAVRGAACASSRVGRVRTELVTRLAAIVVPSRHR